MRQNRTVAADFHVSLIQYKACHGNTVWFLRQVTVVMRVVMLMMHAAGCLLLHRYTRHSTRMRWIQTMQGPVRIPVSQIRCLDCGAVFTVLPSFVLRYQHYEVHLAQALLQYNLIMNVSYRFQASMLGNLNPDCSPKSPMVLWRLMRWLGTAIPVTAFLLKVGLNPPTLFLEDEKFVSEAGRQTYIAALSHQDVIWWVAYLYSTDEPTMTRALLEYKRTVQKSLPEYTAEAATVDAHAASKAALRNTFVGIDLQECILHAQRQVAADLATYQRQHPGVDPAFTAEISSAAWSALSTSTSLYQFSQRLRRIREKVSGDPLLTSRINKLMARRHDLTLYIRMPGIENTSTSLDQVFKWLNRKYFQMQSFMSVVGASAFANAWAIARNCWRFMKGAKKAGQSPIELGGVDLSGKCWLEIVNLCAYGVFSQA